MSPVASTRWCPTPEQVMILEEMYRGGLRTPNAAQIQQITSHLSLYGKIEGKNVFYWFQNHKARDRQKLRKKLLGKHFQQQQQQMMFHQIPPLDNHFQQQPYFLNRLSHFDQLPCCASPPPSVGLHQLPQFVNHPTCFANRQASAGLEDRFPRITNTYAWKGDGVYAKFGGENNKPMMRANNNNNSGWMIRGDLQFDNNSNDHNDDDDDDNSTKRPLKTLELFPIKDKTSLKEDAEICGQAMIDQSSNCNLVCHS